MTAVMFRRQGAWWVHQRRLDDAPAGFVHSICGLSFAVEQVKELAPDTGATCPQCCQELAVQARNQLMEVTGNPVFRPKTAEQALAWAGPRVEILTTLDLDGSGDVLTTVLLDGHEVPITHVTCHVVDPTRGHMRTEWDATTSDVTSDTRLSQAFRDRIGDERDEAVERDAGRWIVDDRPTAAREG